MRNSKRGRQKAGRLGQGQEDNSQNSKGVSSDKKAVIPSGASEQISDNDGQGSSEANNGESVLATCSGGAPTQRRSRSKKMVYTGSKNVTITAVGSLNTGTGQMDMVDNGLTIMNGLDDEKAINLAQLESNGDEDAHKNSNEPMQEEDDPDTEEIVEEAMKQAAEAALCSPESIMSAPYAKPKIWFSAKRQLSSGDEIFNWVNNCINDAVQGIEFERNELPGIGVSIASTRSDNEGHPILLPLLEYDSDSEEGDEFYSNPHIALAPKSTIKKELEALHDMQAPKPSTSRAFRREFAKFRKQQQLMEKRFLKQNHAGAVFQGTPPMSPAPGRKSTRTRVTEPKSEFQNNATPMAIEEPTPPARMKRIAPKPVPATTPSLTLTPSPIVATSPQVPTVAAGSISIATPTRRNVKKTTITAIPPPEIVITKTSSPNHDLISKLSQPREGIEKKVMAKRAKIKYGNPGQGSQGQVVEQSQPEDKMPRPSPRLISARSASLQTPPSINMESDTFQMVDLTEEHDNHIKEEEPKKIQYQQSSVLKSIVSGISGMPSFQKAPSPMPTCDSPAKRPKLQLPNIKIEQAQSPAKIPKGEPEVETESVIPKPEPEIATNSEILIKNELVEEIESISTPGQKTGVRKNRERSSSSASSTPRRGRNGRGMKKEKTLNGFDEIKIENGDDSPSVKKKTTETSPKQNGIEVKREINGDYSSKIIPEAEAEVGQLRRSKRQNPMNEMKSRNGALDRKDSVKTVTTTLPEIEVVRDVNENSIKSELPEMGESPKLEKSGCLGIEAEVEEKERNTNAENTETEAANPKPLPSTSFNPFVKLTNLNQHACNGADQNGDANSETKLPPELPNVPNKISKPKLKSKSHPQAIPANNNIRRVSRSNSSKSLSLPPSPNSDGENMEQQQGTSPKTEESPICETDQPEAATPKAKPKSAQKKKRSLKVCPNSIKVKLLRVEDDSKLKKYAGICQHYNNNNNDDKISGRGIGAANGGESSSTDTSPATTEAGRPVRKKMLSKRINSSVWIW